MKMKKKALLDALKAAKPLTGHKTNLAITGCVLIDAEYQRLVATDLETGLFYPLEIWDCKNGNVFEKMAFQQKLLLKTVMQIEDETVEIIFEDTDVSKPSQGLFDGPLCANINEEYHCMTMPAEDFPSAPVVDWTGEVHIGHLSTDNMAFLLDCVQPHGDLRAFISSVAFWKKRATTTDGCRLHSTNSLGSYDETDPCLVPKHTVLTAKNIGDANAYVSQDGTHCRMECGDGVELITRTMEGDFPEFEHVIKGDALDEISLADKSKLVKTIKKGMVVASKAYNGVVLSVDFAKNSLLLSSTNPDIGEFKTRQSIPLTGCQQSGDCDKYEIVVNPKFLLSALKHVNTKTIMMTDGEYKPLLMTDGIKTAAFMPLKT